MLLGRSLLGDLKGELVIVVRKGSQIPGVNNVKCVKNLELSDFILAKP
jgi:hypothetical protein